MSFITWTDASYGTGVDIADKQHQELFGLINNLHGAVAGGNRSDVGSKLDALIDYVVMHFQTEEKFMQEKNYPGYADHKVEHEKLVGTCADLQTKFHAGEAEITMDTLQFVKDWLDSHIPNIDRKYGPRA